LEQIAFDFPSDRDNSFRRYTESEYLQT
jgi:hypothetical protein